MSNALYACLAVVSGAFLAAQAGFNARLGVLIGDVRLAATSAFLTAFLVVGALWALTTSSLPPRPVLRSVPLHLWALGGLLSALAVSAVYWLIPRLGIGPVIACGLAGQLLTSLVAAHFGWFDLPPAPLTLPKLCGALALLAGALLVTHG